MHALQGASSCSPVPPGGPRAVPTSAGPSAACCPAHRPAAASLAVTAKPVSAPAIEGSALSPSSPPPTTPIHVPTLRRLATPAVPPALLGTVLDRLECGADIGYRGPPVSSSRPNNASARNLPEAVAEAIQREVSRGHTMGPFMAPPKSPFRCNPLGARTKPDGSIRLLLDLSQPAGQSVNAHIDRLQYTVQYTTMDDAVRHIFSVGPHSALLAKADVRHAFRLIPVLPSQRWLLGFQWNDQYYYDVRVPFGLRSACSLFTDLADVLMMTTRFHARHQHVHHYLDDFFFIGQAQSPDCTRAYNTFLSVCDHSQIPLSAEKCCPPSTRMELLGCVLDTAAMTISLPQQKLRALISVLGEARTARTIRQRGMLSLVGKLVHATKCIPAGRSFFRRLLDTAYSVHRPHHWVTITRDTKRDLDWWLSVLPSWNGTAPLIHPTWTPPADLHLHTDASTAGFGGCCGAAWFAEPWPTATVEWANSVS